MQLSNKLSLEGLNVANEYLKTLSIDECALALNLTKEEINSYLDKREVKSYIDRVFSEQAYMSRDKIASTLSTLIANKLLELEEAGVGSKYDILDLLKEAHKISIAERKLAIDELKVQHQLNVQVNNTTNNYGSNWMDLVSKLTAND